MPNVRRGEKRILASLLSGIMLLSAGVAAAEDEKMPLPDKSGYNLFNPTPPEMMRELTPDRPDKTESPYTVDAGHVQLEMDFVNFTHNQSDGVRTRTWNVAPVNLKVGLLNNLDVQLVFDGYLHVRTEDVAQESATTQSGVGDFTPRMKINLWGDDGGRTAFALLPFVKFPTNTDGLGNDAIEGGAVLPLAVKLATDWDMGMETGVRCLRNTENHDYHVEFINSVTVGHDLIGKLAGYLEFFSSISTERQSGWVGTVDFGLTYTLTENVQLDCGCNFGVTRSADDLHPFAGVTLR